MANKNIESKTLTGETPLVYERSNINLIEYVESLDISDKPEQSKVVRLFLEKLQEPIEYKSIFAKFKWSRKYFEEMDELLIKLGYSAYDEAIAEIKKFLYDKIKNIHIMRYNKVLNAGIWNHFDLLKMNLEKIDWNLLSKNPLGIPILKENQDKISWSYLSANPEALELLVNNSGKIDWKHLSANPMAIDTLLDNRRKIDWLYLSSNTHPKAIELLANNQNKIDWEWLSANPGAIELLKMNPQKISWSYLALNSAAIELLKENPHKIRWATLSKNPAAIDLLKQNPTKISWSWISENPAAIDLLTEKINEHNEQKSVLTQKQIEIGLSYIPLDTSRDCIDWYSLSKNNGATSLLKDNPDKIVWKSLSENSHDYLQEKIDHFNKSRFFQRSQLEL